MLKHIGIHKKGDFEYMDEKLNSKGKELINDIAEVSAKLARMDAEIKAEKEQKQRKINIKKEDVK